MPPPEPPTPDSEGTPSAPGLHPGTEPVRCGPPRVPTGPAALHTRPPAADDDTDEDTEYGPL
ncbi:hypothetical protein [Streptomyces sp. NPDC046988]|uniref:hypothetical protein n=1 Tax=Streptomyces sp. NPDC046988 TaxID=3154922 RepID=UPI0033D40982